MAATPHAAADKTGTRDSAAAFAGRMDPGARRQVAAWLLAVCALVFLMIVVGGVTRLTHSGLSITEWQPFVGTIPPLNQEQWEQAFDNYRLTPEFQQRNHWMSVHDFKPIFWMEYAHRLLGRLIGLAYLIPLAYFMVRRKIDRSLLPWLSGIFLLGGLQGAMGWYMVASGLVDDPRVSQYRLTAHLGLALLIFAVMFWTALSLLKPAMNPEPVAAVRRLRRFSYAIVGLIVFMVLTGGFVAGIRAGLAYNTFPLMNGYLVPPELFVLQPWYLNLFNNMATVQFNHRLFAWGLVFSVPIFWLMLRRAPVTVSARRAGTLLLAMLAIQVALGITTLLLKLPVAIAAAHQGGAVVLLGLALWTAHELRRA